MSIPTIYDGSINLHAIIDELSTLQQSINYTVAVADDLREALQYIADVLNDETISTEAKLTRITSQVELIDNL